MSENRDRLWWVLRIGAAACFVGHGAFGIITKASWLPFFGLVGIGPDVAYKLMPIIGTIDIIAGLSVLVRPMPIVFLYMSVWALWTALLRPLAGETVFEAMERAGNYGVPLAMLLLVGLPRNWRRWREWFRASEGALENAATLVRVLQWVPLEYLPLRPVQPVTFACTSVPLC